MLRGGAAAAADQAGAGLAEGQGVLAEIFRVGRVHDAPADLLGPAGVGHDREARLGHRLAHLAQDAPDLRRAAGAVDADHIRARLRPARCATLAGRVAQQGAVIAGEGHRGHHRQVADLAGGGDRLAHLEQVAEGLQDEQVRAGLRQGLDLLGESLAGLLRLHPPKGRQAHAQRPDIARHQHLLEGGRHHPARQLHPGPVDLGQPCPPGRGLPA